MKIKEYLKLKLKKSTFESKISIYEKDNFWKLGFKVVLPSLFISFLFGLYIFIDQTLMLKFVHKNGLFFFDDFLKNSYISKNNSNELISVFEKIYQKDTWNSFYDKNQSIILDKAIQQSNQDVITASVSSIGTINLMYLSIGFFVNSGASVLYSRNLAKKNLKDIKQIWISSFYGCLFLSIFCFLIMALIQKSVIEHTIPNPESLSKINNKINNELFSYFSLRNNAIVSYVNNYIWFITASIPLVSILNLLVFFLRAEGKNLLITIFSLICSFFNILFDLLFFVVLKTNIYGGGIATFLGYIINLLIVAGYICYLNRKNELNFGFKDLKNFTFKANIFISSLALSLGTFLRDLSLTIANIFYIVVFSRVMGTIAPNDLREIASLSLTPIYFLLFFSMFGIIDGMRPIMAYNYEQKNYKKVKQSYYYGMILGFVFSIICAVIVLSSLQSSSFQIFLNIVPSRYNIALILMFALIFQLPLVAINCSGLSLLQASGKTFLSNFASLIQGFITFFIIVYSIGEIALNFKLKNLMLFAGFINILVASVIIEIISEIYLHVYMGKKEKSSDPVAQTDKIIFFIENKLLKFKNK